MLAVEGAIAFPGSPTPVGLGLILQSAGWVALATAVVTSLSTTRVWRSGQLDEVRNVHCSAPVDRAASSHSR